MNIIRRHWIPGMLLLAAGLLALLPVLNAYTVIGDAWRGVPQGYSDEILYYNQVQEVAQGYPWFGNQYLYEYRDGLTLVFFGGHWLAALPLLLGIPLIPALVLNFVLWSMVFVLLAYWLLREIGTSKLVSAAGSFLSYLSVYLLIFRPSSRQEVLPFFLLFYIALMRFLKRPEAVSSVVFLGIATGATFYVFSYLWQVAVVTLGLLAAWALYSRHWPLLRSTLLASALGGLIGLPIPLYMLYQYLTVPHYVESLSRFGLVHTHLPMGEVLYSGGWVGFLLVVAGVLYWRIPALRDRQFSTLLLFAVVTGMGLWIMQGSNLITGKLLETGEHIKPFIGPWFIYVAVPLMVVLRRRWLASAVVGGALVVVSVVFMQMYLQPFIDIERNRSLWLEQQTYAAPLAWLEAREAKPVVIWSDSSNYLTAHIPLLTKHYVLHAQPAIFTLVPDRELHERYLVANYFNNPTEEDLRRDLERYVGRGDAFHRSKTVEREIKICRILRYREECGTPPTAVDLMGDAFFKNLADKFANDVRPNIMEYLKEYHVSYIVKDTVRESQMDPQLLGAKPVYDDGRYEIYEL